MLTKHMDGLMGLAAALCLLAASAAIAQQHGQWEFLAKKDGVYVWKREQTGQEMPGFRGRVFIQAGPEEILREMMDWKRHTDWMYACAESSMLKQLSDQRAIMYNRVEAPWPLWDRDVIVDTRIVRGEDVILVRFKNIDSPLRPVPRRVVRLPLLEGFYQLQEVKPGQTKVVYQVVTDIGGSVPRWLAIRGAAALPYETLTRLRKRVEARRAASQPEAGQREEAAATPAGHAS